jgi:hypothetical protein
MVDFDAGTSKVFKFYGANTSDPAIVNIEVSFSFSPFDLCVARLKPALLFLLANDWKECSCEIGFLFSLPTEV